MSAVHTANFKTVTSRATATSRAATAYDQAAATECNFTIDPNGERFHTEKALRIHTHLRYRSFELSRRHYY